jgi:hypothetical protein
MIVRVVWDKHGKEAGCISVGISMMIRGDRLLRAIHKILY